MDAAHDNSNRNEFHLNNMSQSSGFGDGPMISPSQPKGPSPKGMLSSSPPEPDVELRKEEYKIEDIPTDEKL